MLKPVVQEETTGCGIASVANILGKTYSEMKAEANAMGIYASDKSLWSDTQYVRRMLSSVGVETSDEETPFEFWETLPDLALLSIKHHQEEGKNFWHWVVFKRVNGQPFVLDSASYLPSNIRQDFAAMQPKWFIEVKMHNNSFKPTHTKTHVKGYWYMNIRKAQPEDHQTLLAIWEQSVRASHDFLSEQDIQLLIPMVRDQALPGLEVWVLCDESSAPIGFMGLDNNKLEALFISPTSFRRGGGKLMLEYARKLKGELQVDVNEQNPSAVAFYLSNGFVVAGRSPTDSQGLPFPLLHLSEAFVQQK